MKFLKEQGLRDQLCAKFVRDAAEILGDLLVPGAEAGSE
jgi:hypothetical protein